jgi:hypothetical protein
MALFQRKICRNYSPNFLGVTETSVCPVASGELCQVQHVPVMPSYSQHVAGALLRDGNEGPRWAKGEASAASGLVCAVPLPHDQNMSVNCKVLRNRAPSHGSIPRKPTSCHGRNFKGPDLVVPALRFGHCEYDVSYINRAVRGSSFLASSLSATSCRVSRSRYTTIPVHKQIFV